MHRTHSERPPTRRQPLHGSPNHKLNQQLCTTIYNDEDLPSKTTDDRPQSAIPHNLSLVSNGIRQVPEHSPQNKRISAISTEERNTNRDSQISNASSTGSNPSRRKTHIGPWQLGKTIGRGGCGRVRVVRHATTGQYGAAKIISKATAEKVRALSLANLIKSAEQETSMFPGGKVIPFGLEREIVIMKLLDHPNIVKLYDVWENRNELYLIMEYVHGGELFQYINELGGLREIEVVHLFRQIIAALLYCNRINIHHRDLKPENILLDRTTMQIKLVDFGMAALQPEGRQLSTPCGSPHYAAPEVIRFKEYDGAMADVWSCGVILYVMLTGTPPFNMAADDRNLKELFRIISQAKYTMPEHLSKEAKNLIRRILIADPRSRIRLQDIWEHPFLHKYEEELNFTGKKAELATWLGPSPDLDDWEPLTRKTIDREILRNMRTLWHSEKEESIIQSLLNDEANQHKYFYAAILRHREDQLENLPPSTTVRHSISDYHHSSKPSSRPYNVLRPPSRMQHDRSQSAYSILNDEHLYSKHSFYETPASGCSYDPFRASKEAMVPETSSPVNVTVHRGSESGSRKLRSGTGLSSRQTIPLRLQTLKKSKQRSSHNLVSQSDKNSPAPSYISTAYSQRSKASSHRSMAHSHRSRANSQRSVEMRQRSISRTTLGSSAWVSSTPVSIRPSNPVKRAVSFNHLRKASAATASTQATNGPQYTPEQRRFLEGSRVSTVVSSVAPVRPVTQPAPSKRSPVDPSIHNEHPPVKMRPKESPTKYIQSEARKVSSELEKHMEEVFNRGSIDSSTRTLNTDRIQDGHVEFDTPPTSFSNRNSGGSSVATPNISAIPTRPLPPVPDETPTSFVQRKLAQTRDEIVQRIAAEGSGNSETLIGVIEHLNNMLNVPPGDSGKRVFSAPTKSSDYPAVLPVISEEVKTLDGDDGYNHLGAGQRAVTAPGRPNLLGRRAATEHNTIRLVEQSPPQISIAPLNIRKRSGASTSLSSRSTDAERTAQRPDSSKHAPVRPYQEVFEDLRSACAKPPMSPIDEVSMEPSLEKEKLPTLTKKSSWFRFGKAEKDVQQETHHKHDSMFKIPERWTSHDDRIKQPISPIVSNSGQAPVAKNPSDDSSEFPPRRQNGGSSSGNRKGFFGLFTRKAKDGKDKGMLGLASHEGSSVDSLLSGFDFGPGDEGSGATRSHEYQMNWLARFLHIKPASKALCLQVGRGRARTDFVRLFRDWQRYGIKRVTFDREKNSIEVSVSKQNELKMKPVSLVIELFVVLEHGRRANLCIARFTQTRGAASSFRKVVEIVEDICRNKNMLVENEAKKAAMMEVLD